MKQITRVTSKPESCDQEKWENFCYSFFADIESGLFPSIMGKGVCSAVFVDLLNFTVITTLIFAENHNKDSLLTLTKSLEVIHNKILTRFQ